LEENDEEEEWVAADLPCVSLSLSSPAVQDEEESVDAAHLLAAGEYSDSDEVD